MQRDPVGRLMRSPAGALVARPWFDWAALRFITRRYLPLSRGWAAARAAQGSVERFFAGISVTDTTPRMREQAALALGRIARLEDAAARAVRRWEEAAFGPERRDGTALAAVERERRAAAHALMAGRAQFVFLLRRGLLPAVCYDMADPADAAARYGAMLAAPERAYAAPEPLPEIAESGRFAGADAIEYWFRFRSPSAVMADTVHARVFEPAGVADPPTLIFGHGLFVEAEHFQGMPSAARALLGAGTRVVEIETPWHGRRTPHGRYGGECFVAGGPAGAVDLFAAQAREIAVIVAWCRRSSRGPVAVGGLSLGALVGQLVGVHARHWPPAMRPDALLLLTCCDRLDRLVIESTLARALGLPRALDDAGWTPEALARWRPLTDPVGEPAVPPENIVALLGSRDTVTPFARGEAMFARWGVPCENLFVRRQGHFSAALGMLHDTSHLSRLRGILMAKTHRR